ncbi:MAG TPA: allene oxide cyclase family protein [Ktedonobacteraceae bacterium]|nr:allene oxide cyclase family protein [Ktedonobacteraceae bacterium]
MKKSLIPTGVVALVLIGLAVAMLVINTGVFAAHANSDIKIHVIEHAITDTVGDADNGTPAPDALGNVLAFHNPVFDPADKKQVGVDNGQCTRTITSTTSTSNDGVWECFWTVILAGGQITVEGPFNDNFTDTTLAITGGTGAYQDAHGQMRLHARTIVQGVTTEYDFFYQVKL